MNRWITTLLLFLSVLPLATFAQNVGGGALLSGVASQIDGDGWGGYNKLGFSLGGFAWYDFNDRFSLSPEILIGMRGSREVKNAYGKFDLSVIDVPVLLRYRVVGSPSAASLLLEAGPSANILISAKSGFGNIKQNVLPNFNKFNISGSLGASYFFNPKIALTGRWTYSLTNMSKSLPQSESPYWRCHFILFGIRLAFK